MPLHDDDASRPDGEVRCTNNHVLVRFEVERCDGGHAHRVYRCPMRRGSGSCGRTETRPRRNGDCEPGKGRDREDYERDGD